MFALGDPRGNEGVKPRTAVLSNQTAILLLVVVKSGHHVKSDLCDKRQIIFKAAGDRRTPVSPPRTLHCLGAHAQLADGLFRA
jgi:hypothetical protein